MTWPPNFRSTHRRFDMALETLIIPCGLHLWPYFGTSVKMGNDSEQIEILAMFNHKLVQYNLFWGNVYGWTWELVIYSEFFRVCIIYDRWKWYWDTIWDSQMVLSISYQNVTLTKKGSDEGRMTFFSWDSKSWPISSFNTCSYQVAILDVKNKKNPFFLGKSCV